ncbi:cupin domain-containing protein [Vulgatibacter sp.]|uniref:cupin domain-containing protein n=1 Tax=Vulgatibacter sp. TaxID=1971226 RepID=UPI0035674FA6
MTATTSNGSLVHLDDARTIPIEHANRFAATARPLARAAGGGAIGATHYEVPPGKSAFPFHYHCGVDEALFVLEGQGTLRLGPERHAVRAGHWVTFRPGPDSAHELVNTGSTPLRYLCLSTQATADVIGYPDSQKVAAVGSSSADFFDPPWIRGLYRIADTVEYYDGEDDR